MDFTPQRYHFEFSLKLMVLMRWTPNYWADWKATNIVCPISIGCISKQCFHFIQFLHTFRRIFHLQILLFDSLVLMPQIAFNYCNTLNELKKKLIFKKSEWTIRNLINETFFVFIRLCELLFLTVNEIVSWNWSKL